MVKAILMDFNGVVIDDEGIQLRVYREILENEGIELTDADYFSSLGMDDKTFTGAALLRGGREADMDKILELTAAKTARWREIVSESVPIFPGIENFVRKMANDFTLGLVSMSKREEIDFVLERTGLTEFYATIVSAEDVENCKPDPECYRLGFRQIDEMRTAAGRHAMTHGECVVIEDSPPGVAAGKSAGLRVLGVSNTVSADELRKAGAEYAASDLDDWMPESFQRVFA